MGGGRNHTLYFDVEMPRTPKRIVVHPIVLLSVVDHFNRLSKIGNPGRVVGVLLGSWRKGDVVDVASSFAGTYV